MIFRVQPAGRSRFHVSSKLGTLCWLGRKSFTTSCWQQVANICLWVGWGCVGRSNQSQGMLSVRSPKKLHGASHSSLAKGPKRVCPVAKTGVAFLSLPFSSLPVAAIESIRSHMGGRTCWNIQFPACRQCHVEASLLLLNGIGPRGKAKLDPKGWLLGGFLA